MISLRSGLEGMSDYGLSSNIDPDDKRQPLWKEQRETRGFDDTETWDLQSTIADFLVPRLERFKELNCGYPPEMSMKKWENILQTMIDGFKEMQRIDEDDFDQKKVKRGLKMFKKWYFDLWW